MYTVVPPLSELIGPWLCLDNRKVRIIEFVRISVTVGLPTPNSLANDADFSPFEAQVQIHSLSSMHNTVCLRFAVLATHVC